MCSRRHWKNTGWEWSSLKNTFPHHEDCVMGIIPRNGLSVLGRFHWNLFPWVQLAISIIGSDNGSSPKSRQWRVGWGAGGVVVGVGVVGWGYGWYMKRKLFKQDDVIKWKRFPRYWPFLRGIHRWLVNSQHKGQWREALLFSSIFAWRNGWVNNDWADDWDAIAPIMTSLQWYRKFQVVMSSLVVLNVVITTTSSATNGDTNGIMTTLGFQWSIPSNL